MARLVTFGEIMLRLCPPDFLRLIQTSTLEMSFGGGEANVAVSASQFGLDAALVTCLPDNPLGDACVRSLQSRGVDTSLIVRSGSRIGIYFLEAGAVQRPSKVIYDRSNSAIAEVASDAIDWKAVLKDADWFHVTGITPAISKNAADQTLKAVEAADELGVTVSCDLNYRKKLWKWGKQPGEVMQDVVKHVTVAVGNEEDAEKVFGIKAPDTDVESGKVDADAYRYVGEELMKKFPNLKKVAITLRGSISASHNTWSAVLYDGETLHQAKRYDITHIVDRVGGGDSFAAGLIYGLSSGKSDADALEFAVAASCMKHTIKGDWNDVTVDEVEALAAGGGSGRVQR